MQYISFNPARISTPGAVPPRGLEPASNHRTEPANPASTLHVRFYQDTRAYDRGFQAFYDEPIGEDFDVDQQYKTWKLVTVWAVAIVGSWALFIGGVLMVRSFLH